MTPAPSAGHAFNPAWSPECWAFYEHWQSLRRGAVMPTTEDFLDTMPARFVRSVYIIEVTATESLVRFQGTELVDRWGFDATGRDVIVGRSEVVQARMVALLAAMALRPCGYYSRIIYVTSRARPIEAHIVRFPLAVRAGRPPRIVSYTKEQDTLDEGETGWNRYENLEHGWIDIGAGVPAAPPLVLSG